MNIKGVIIRATPYKDSGAMVNILSNDKVYGFYARNIYKVENKNILITTPLMYAEFTFSDNKKDFLTFKEMTPLLDTRVYMNDFAKLAAIDFLNEVTVRLFTDEDMPKIYPYLIKSLELIKENENIFTVLLVYLAVSLKLNGYGLNVDSCIITNSKHNIVGVSYVDGGLVSKEAYRSSRHKLYTPEKIKIIRSIFKATDKDLDKIHFLKRNVREVFDDMLIYTYDQTGIRFKSESLIKN